MERRDFFKKAAVVAGAAAVGSSTLEAGTTGQPVDNRKVSMVTFPEKRPLIMYSDRPPLLETPREVFTSVLTPNDQFFVRWHMPDIPTYIDPDTFTISVNGLVEKELKISLNDLKTKFEQVEVTAVLQCGGNSRSAFKPIAGGIQWGSGAMGCATWKGVRLRDILDHAGLKKDAKWIGFNGSEKAAYYETPEFIRELELTELDDNVILAYEMSGEDLPYLNGYPLRLVLPGYYSDSWVKMLSNITVTNKYKKLFFMDVAYRVPDNETESETPEKKFPKTKPIKKMNVKSIIGYPENGDKLSLKSHTVVRGVAFDDGHGIKEVLVSTDAGKTWEKALLDDGKLGRYAYRAFRFSFKPNTLGKVTIMAKAINKIGEEQPLSKDILWNHGGYKYNGIDEVTVEVI
ncbi:MAG TPA: twin-arginine translocation signal domain-containing protein [Sulfurovum sp.]|nr:twin-arginine translocation signal domain-containing protein [Sulfurovum sp.]